MVKQIITVLALSVVLLGIGQSKIYGQNSDENLPIPKFNSPPQQKLASELRDAMLSMRRHLCAKTSPPSDQWERRFEVLLTELVVAQHRTVWAAAGDFDGDLGDHTSALSPFYVKKDGIRDLLTKAAQRNPANAAEIRQIIEKLNENSRAFSAAANAQGFGAKRSRDLRQPGDLI